MHFFVSFCIIHPNFYLKTKIFFKHLFSDKQMMRKVRMYETVQAFLEDDNREGPLEKKNNKKTVGGGNHEQNLKVNKQIIGSLPVEIFDTYMAEYETLESNINPYLCREVDPEEVDAPQDDVRLAAE